MSALAKYNAARTALAEAHAVDEVRDIRDKAEAMAAYARQAKDTELVEWATEIKVRAERRAGQMLADMPKHPGDLMSGKSPRSHDVTAGNQRLADIGVTKNESSRWQKLATVSDEKFEHAVAAAKEVAGEVTTAAMLRAAKNQEPGPLKPAAPAPAIRPEPADDPHADLIADAERLVAENRALQQRVDVLAADDKVAKLSEWMTRYHQLEGRLDQAITTSNEAKRDATRKGKVLAQIRTFLGVERDSEILPKLKGGA